MRWLRSDTVKIILITVAMFAVMEGIVRLLGLGQDDALPTTAATSDYSLERVHGDDWEDYLIVGQEQSTSSVYSPFVEYTSGPRDGQFVTVTDDGIRCQSTAKVDCGVNGGTGEVWVFGGSTTFGYGVKNDETIPAYLNRLLPDHNVINFGVASYYSTVERIKFFNLLTQYDPPAAAVFVDGLNDFYYHQIPDVSGASDKLRNVFELPDHLRTLAKLDKFARQSALVSMILDAVRGDAAEVLIEQRSDAVLQRIIRRLERNTAMRNAVGAQMGIQIVNILQPVPLFGVGHATSFVPESFLNFKDHANSGRGYELIHEGSALLDDPTVVNLADLTPEGQMYVDTVHYHPEVNAQIARAIFDQLRLD